MTCLPDSALRILELEARQDEALRQLAELEQQLEAVLAAACAASPLFPANGTGSVAATVTEAAAPRRNAA